MAKTIHKYQLEIKDVQEIDTFIFSRPVAFQLQNGIPTLWMEVDPSFTKGEMKFYIFGTGHEIRSLLRYIGTIQDGGFVWHLYY